jgi:lipoprotein-anchoring transpeptidase ErfK/SrfK
MSTPIEDVRGDVRIAIYGSYDINPLGGPASHGCVRLHPANAATLFALVQQRGMSDTVIVVSGGYGFR